MHGHLRSRYLAWLGCLFSLVLGAAAAAPGDLDPTFSGDGRLTFGFGANSSFCSATTVQADGRILLGGWTQDGSSTDFALARLLADGSFDPTFSGDGKVSTNFGSAATGSITALAIQPDGKILAGGQVSTSENGVQFGLARYLPNGTLDSTFSEDGMLTASFDGLNAYATSMAVQPDGRILLAGSTSRPEMFALARFLPDGSPDTPFGSNGKLVTSAGAISRGNAITLQPDGKILLAGVGSNPGSGTDFALLRFDPDGSLDGSFGGDGVVTTDFHGGGDGAAAVAVLPDGKILAAGSSYPLAGESRFALARYFPDGSLDTSFGTGGIKTSSFSNLGCFASSMVVTPEGRIVLGGFSATESGGYDFAVARYLSDGTPDPTFDGDGLVSTQITPGLFDDVANALALQPDGKILVVGWTNIGDFPGPRGFFQFAAARFGASNADITPPSCSVGAVVSGATVYIPITLSDAGTGVAAVQLTGNSSNCRLEWDSPSGTVMTPVGGTIPITPAAASTIVRAVKLNNSLRARVELRVADAAGNVALCDPVIATLTVGKEGRLVRTFRAIPGAEHFVALRNGTPGITRVRLTVNGRTVLTGKLTDAQEIKLDLARWMHENGNRVEIIAQGPRGAEATLLIGDASLAAAGRTPNRTYLPPAYQANVEFSP